MTAVVAAMPVAAATLARGFLMHCNIPAPVDSAVEMVDEAGAKAVQAVLAAVVMVVVEMAVGMAVAAEDMEEVEAVEAVGRQEVTSEGLAVVVVQAAILVRRPVAGQAQI